MFEDIRHTAISATSKVFETMFFIFLEPQQEGEEIEQTSSESSPDFLGGEIGFGGKYSGKLRLYLPLELAQKMASNFLGLEEEKASESQTADMVNELCNMICGNLFSQLDSKITWDLTLPRSSPIPYQDIEEGIKTSGINVDFNAEGYEIKLTIQLEN